MVSDQLSASTASYRNTHLGQRAGGTFAEDGNLGKYGNTWERKKKKFGRLRVLKPGPPEWASHVLPRSHLVWFDCDKISNYRIYLKLSIFPLSILN